MIRCGGFPILVSAEPARKQPSGNRVPELAGSCIVMATQHVATRCSVVIGGSELRKRKPGYEFFRKARVVVVVVATALCTVVVCVCVCVVELPYANYFSRTGIPPVVCRGKV